MSATARLSDAAIACAAARPTRDADHIARRLYDYGRLPLTDAWLATVAAHGGPAGYLDLGRLRRIDPTFVRRWAPREGARSTAGWLVWDRASRRHPARPTARAIYKLYVAPAPTAMPRALPVIATIARSDAFAFKVAATGPALLRPDKLVAYFHTRVALEAAAAALRPALDGVLAHPVPFTAAIVDDGMLSWGMDPPDGTRGRALTPGSWRGWLTARLGAYLAEGPEGEAATASIQRARQRLEHDGIDVSTWAPHAPRWGAA